MSEPKLPNTHEALAVACRLDQPVRPGAEAHKLTDHQIADMAFSVLRAHNDDRLWRALTYSSGPYEVTTPTVALCHLARVFFGAGLAAADGTNETHRITLEFIAEHFSSDWPDRCQINVQAARRALAATSTMDEPRIPHPDYPCRMDGRCQYAIDHGAEGLGHCPRGKCVMPPEQPAA